MGLAIDSSKAMMPVAWSKCVLPSQTWMILKCGVLHPGPHATASSLLTLSSPRASTSAGLWVEDTSLSRIIGSPFCIPWDSKWWSTTENWTQPLLPNQIVGDFFLNNNGTMNFQVHLYSSSPHCKSDYVLRCPFKVSQICCTYLQKLSLNQC